MTYGELINHIKEESRININILDQEVTFYSEDNDEVYVVNDVDVSYGSYSIKDEQFLLIG